MFINTDTHSVQCCSLTRPIDQVNKTLFLQILRMSFNRSDSFHLLCYISPENVRVFAVGINFLRSFNINKPEM